MAGTALPASTATLRSDFVQQAPAAAGGRRESLEIVFRPDPTIGDGEYANNGWLQETPKTVTRLTWDNAAMISPATAQQMGLVTGDYVTLQIAGREAKARSIHRSGSCRQFRHRAPRLRAFARRQDRHRPRLQRESAADSGGALDGHRPADHENRRELRFASVQHQYTIDFDGHPSDATDFASDTAFRRDLVQIGTLDDFRKNPAFAQNESNQVDYHGPSLYPNFKYDGYAWGMSIDLNRCVGCNACVVACHVGKQHCRGRQGSGEARARRCTGSASTPISAAASTIPRSTTSRCLACSAKTRPANTSARWAPRRTAPKG